MDKTKILIVEDDEDMCEELRDIFEGEGYSVDIAYNGIDGIRSVEINGYSCILLDLKLPGLSGADVLKYINTNAPSLKVIILTGNPLIKGENNEFKRTHPELSSAYALINKPFNPEDVLGKIKEISSK